MTGPYVTCEQYQHTEWVYHDADGNEVGRERQYDDSWYDTLWERTMTKEEEEDWL
jgi:hypothetical protein